MKLVLACPGCSRPARVEVDAQAVDWQCSGCDHSLHFEPVNEISTCPVCANAELYKKKDFPHWLGLTILAGACIGFLVFQGLYIPSIAWSLLLGLAVADAALYLWVGDVFVCYRCHAHLRGELPADAKPYDIGIAERYRQEQIRKSSL